MVLFFIYNFERTFELTMFAMAAFLAPRPRAAPTFYLIFGEIIVLTTNKSILVGNAHRIMVGWERVTLPRTLDAN